ARSKRRLRQRQFTRVVSAARLRLLPADMTNGGQLCENGSEVTLRLTSLQIEEMQAALRNFEGAFDTPARRPRCLVLGSDLNSLYRLPLLPRPVMTRTIELELSSAVAADRQSVLQHVASLAGVNEELRPILRMTAPRSFRDRSLFEWPVGQPLFRS